ncbi:MAG: hypothetical protein ACI4XM_01410 [Candidatus Coprovivens sp.]
MKNETNGKEKKDKKVGLTILSTAGIVCSTGLGVLYYLQTKEVKALKMDKELYKEAYEGVAEKLIQQGETAELVKRVVGGPLIDRLIKNEELKRSRVENKITNLMNKGMDEATKIVLKEKEADRQAIIETIADFINVKEALR